MMANIGTSNVGKSRLRAIEVAIGSIAGLVVMIAAASVHDTNVNVWLTATMAVIAFALVAHAGAFKVAISMEDWQVVPTVAVASTLGFVGTAIGELFLRQTVHSLGQHLLSSVVTFGALSAGVLFARCVVRLLWRGGLFRTTAVLVGNEYTTHELALEVSDHQQLGIDIIGQSALLNDGSLARLVDDVRPDRVIIAGQTVTSDMELAATLSGSHARVYLMPQLLAFRTGSAWFSRHQVNGFPLLRVDQKSPLGPEEAVIPVIDLVRERPKSMAE